VRDDTIHGVKVKMKDFYGAYFKVGLPTSVGLYPYVIAGATHGKVEARNRRSSTKTDLSYGLGADYWFNQKISADLEYAKYFDKDGVELDGVTLGVNYKF
jgi:outer membrane autotransporter protein